MKCKRNIIIFIYIFILAFPSLDAFAEEEAVSAPDKAYNQGVDFFEKLDYNKAADRFMQSLNTQDKKLEHFSAYNLAAALFAQGLEAEKQGPQEANEIYKKALDLYKRAIEIDPDDLDAKYNYELTAKKIIEQEKKKQDQKNQNKQDQQKNQKDKQEQKNKEQQDQGGQKNKDEQDNQQNKQEENRKDDQKAGDRQDQNFDDAQGKQDKPDKRNQQSSATEKDQMSKEEAQMLLDNFQDSEEQRKTRKLKKSQQKAIPGVKGW